MFKTLGYIQKHFVFFIPLAMIAGLIFGSMTDASFLRLAIAPLIILMVFPMMLGMNFRSLLSGVDVKLQLTTQMFNFLVIPFVAYFLGVIFLSGQPYLSLGLLLMGLLPTAGVTIAWCGFANGNVTSSVKMVVIGLTLGGLLTPVYINFLMGEVVSIPFLLILKKIGYIIFLPMALAILTRAILIKKYGMEYFQQQIKPNFAQIAAIGPLAIVFIGLSLRANYIVNNPQVILWLLIPLSLFYLINYTLGTILAKLFFNREDGMALIFSAAMRHLAISLAVAFTVFGDKGADIAIIITVAFILQPQFAAWYLKIANKIFPVPPKTEATTV